MKVGIYTNAFKNLPFEEALKKISSYGIDMVELGCGEESGTIHCDPDVLLADEMKFEEFKSLLEKYHLQISALSCHGNPVSPNEEQRALSIHRMENAVLLCEKLGLDTINCFSGCPGDWEGASLANWVTISWPLDYAKAYEWQWKERLIPFWKSFTQFARTHSVTKIAIEMHPGQCCYNPKTIKRLRNECGPEIGVNLDFSHLLWQRMDPILIIRELKGMIYHMHAKDVYIDPWMAQKNGLINTAFYDEIEKRSWNFRTIGMGHGLGFWREVFAELRRCGYDYVASIEMECEVLTMSDGIPKAVAFLRQCVPADPEPTEESWQKKTAAGRKKRFAQYGLAYDD